MGTKLLSFFLLASCAKPFSKINFLGGVKGVDTNDKFATTIRPILEKSACLGCHAGADPRGKINLDFATEKEALAEVDLWRQVIHVTKVVKTMPPEPLPGVSEVDIHTIEDWAGMGESCNVAKEGSRQPSRRLNTREFINSVEDIFSYTDRPALKEILPSDSYSSGLDNLSSNLSWQINSLGSYISAAETIGKAISGFPSGAAFRHIFGTSCATVTENCLRTALPKLLYRAFRREITSADITSYLNFFKVAIPYETNAQKVERVLTSILLSGEFLNVADYAGVGGCSQRSRSPFSLATRLSLLIWGRLPDVELLDLAKSGQLLQPATLRSQITRLVKDSKANHLIDDFFYPIFDLQYLQGSQKDETLFPDFDVLKPSMLQETQIFFREAILNDGKPLGDILTANYSYLNETMARHYGVSGVTGTNFRLVTDMPAERSGLMTHASVLSSLAHEYGNALPRRGAVVATEFEGIYIGAPVIVINNNMHGSNSGIVTLRQEFDQTTLSGSCVSCHAIMNARGGAFENFDAIGKTRTLDRGLAVDTRGILLPDNFPISSAKEMLLHIRGKRQFLSRLATRSIQAFNSELVDTNLSCKVSQITQTLTDGTSLEELLSRILETEVGTKVQGD